MFFEEAEHAGENGTLTRALTQGFGIHAGEAEEPGSERLVARDESERAQGERLGVGRGGTVADHRAVLVAGVDGCERRCDGTGCHMTHGQDGLVLVVEDDDLNRHLFSELLAAEGFAVDSVGSGAGALAKVREARPAIVLLDVQLPDMSGIEVLRALRADPATASLPVVAVTAYSGPGDAERLTQAGATAYIAKPVPIMRLLALLRETLGRVEAGPQPAA